MASSSLTEIRQGIKDINQQYIPSGNIQSSSPLTLFSQLIENLQKNSSSSQLNDDEINTYLDNFITQYYLGGKRLVLATNEGDWNMEEFNQNDYLVNFNNSLIVVIRILNDSTQDKQLVKDMLLHQATIVMKGNEY